EQVAADRQLASTWALNGHALADLQLAAGERDGLSVQAGGEDDRVLALGGGDLRPQRAGAAVQVVRDRQRAGPVAGLERFQLRAEGGGRAAMGSSSPRAPVRRVLSQPGQEPHGFFLSGTGLRREGTFGPGAQTVRRAVGKRLVDTRVGEADRSPAIAPVFSA